MGNPRLLICDDEAGLRETLRVLFERAGYDVTVCENVEDGKKQLTQASSFDLVISDLMMPDGSGLEVLEAARAHDPSTQVIMITAYATTEQAVQAMRLGAYDYVQKPFRNDELRATAEKALEKRHIVLENQMLRARVREGFRFGRITGKSAAIQQVMNLVEKVAPSRSSVLITGESGTGKEVVARSIHEKSPRADKPFVVINCGALPENLMESELFGHEKGAFSGAVSAHLGLIRTASEGTLFLDEIGELSLPLQVKLLRVLQDRRVRPVGGQKEFDVDVRILAATNREVEREVVEGRFREDLFYRLNVIRIHLPPLRQRAEDIVLLANVFLDKHNAEQGRSLAFSSDAIAWLAKQPFPGNIRQLENMVERAVILASTSTIHASDLMTLSEPGTPATPDPDLPEQGFVLDDYLANIERAMLLKALNEAGGKRSKAAERLGMTFRSFRYRLAKLGLDDEGIDDIVSEDTSRTRLPVK